MSMIWIMLGSFQRSTGLLRQSTLLTLMLMVIIMLKVEGTVPEKKAQVEQLTEDKALVEAIYKRAYNTLKVKLEMAEKIYSGLKKALSKRIAEVDLDRFSKDSYISKEED